MAVARVNDKLQIEELEIYYDPTGVCVCVCVCVCVYCSCCLPGLK